MSKIRFPWNSEWSATCWIARGSDSRPVFFKIVLVGFTKMETPCDVPDSFFALCLRHFSFFRKIGESSSSWISRAIECGPQIWLVKIAPPTIEKYPFFCILVVRSQRTLFEKNPTWPSVRGVRVRGAFLVVGVGTKFITPRKPLPWSWGKLIFFFFGCTDCGCMGFTKQYWTPYT